MQLQDVRVCKEEKEKYAILFKLGGMHVYFSYHVCACTQQMHILWVYLFPYQ